MPTTGRPRIVEPRARHTFEVTDVLKHPAGTPHAVGERIAVEQMAGEVEDEGRIVEVSPSRAELLRPGARYVLFLAGRTANGRYVPVNDLQGVIPLVGDTAVPHDGANTVPSGPASGLLARLRTLAAQRATDSWLLTPDSWPPTPATPSRFPRAP